MAKIIFSPTEKYSYHEELDPETNRKYFFQKSGEYDVPDFICDILMSRYAYKGYFSRPLSERVQNLIKSEIANVTEVVDSFVKRIEKKGLIRKRGRPKKNGNNK